MVGKKFRLYFFHIYIDEGWTCVHIALEQQTKPQAMFLLFQAEGPVHHREQVQAPGVLCRGVGGD